MRNKVFAAAAKNQTIWVEEKLPRLSRKESFSWVATIWVRIYLGSLLVNDDASLWPLESFSLMRSFLAATAGAIDLAPLVFLLGSNVGRF